MPDESALISAELTRCPVIKSINFHFRVARTIFEHAPINSGASNVPAIFYIQPQINGHGSEFAMHLTDTWSNMNVINFVFFTASVSVLHALATELSCNILNLNFKSSCKRTATIRHFEEKKDIFSEIYHMIYRIR